MIPISHQAETIAGAISLYPGTMMQPVSVPFRGGRAAGRLMMRVLDAFGRPAMALACVVAWSTAAMALDPKAQGDGAPIPVDVDPMPIPPQLKYGAPVALDPKPLNERPKSGFFE